MDLYASNIMWRAEAIDDNNIEQAVSIKIVDWDAAHCLHEGQFPPKIEILLKERIYLGQAIPFGVAHDEHYLAVYDMPILKTKHHRYWRDLASGEKSCMDAAFYKLMTRAHK